jgi:hypothetical protein
VEALDGGLTVMVVSGRNVGGCLLPKEYELEFCMFLDMMATLSLWMRCQNACHLRDVEMTWNVWERGSSI